MKRGVRRSALVLAAGAALVVSLTQTAGSALEYCPQQTGWKQLDRKLDDIRYWDQQTQGGCVSIINIQ